MSTEEEIDALRLSSSLLRAAQAHFAEGAGPPEGRAVHDALAARLQVLEGLIKRAQDRAEGRR